MDLKQLQSLLAVAEHGSFTAAARAIHTVQSNVSTHVARLEHELGTTLVDRHSGRLTEEGEAVVARARRVRSELDAVVSDVAALRDVVVGSVRVGMIGSIARWLVPSLLTQMRERHPRVELVIVDATTTSLVPQLHDGMLDIAVVNLPVNDPGLEEEPLFREERILVAPLDDPLALLARSDGAPVPLAALEGHRLIMEPRGTAFRSDLDGAATEAGIELGVLAEVDGMTLVASLALRGYGPAILPATALLDRAAGDWVRIPLDGLQDRIVGFVWRRTSRLAAPARAAREVLMDLLRAEAPLHRGVEVDI